MLCLIADRPLGHLNKRFQCDSKEIKEEGDVDDAHGRTIQRAVDWVGQRLEREDKDKGEVLQIHSTMMDAWILVRMPRRRSGGGGIWKEKFI